MNPLSEFGVLPIDYSTIVNSIGDYKSPKDKVAIMEKSGELIRIKKGLYVVSPELSKRMLSKELIANHLYGPSYISLESALSFYKLIPERVFVTRSIATKRSKVFKTKLGDFDYIQLDSSYFSIGVRQEIVDNQYAFLIATPEKAICDLIVSTSGLRIQSLKAIKSYLEEDLRIDFSVLENIDLEIIRECILKGKKKTELIHLLKYFEK